MCHKQTTILRCGHESQTLSYFHPCARFRRLQEDKKKNFFTRHTKLKDCGNVTRERHRDDSRVCGTCYGKQKQELRARREREQQAEAKRVQERSEILNARVQQDLREKERRERAEAERRKGMERDARRRKAEEEEDMRKRERRAYREDMARKREEEERQRQQEKRSRAERAERERREREAKREAEKRAKAEAERRKAEERAVERQRRETEERKRREEKEPREKRQRAAAENARRNASSSSSTQRPTPPPGRLADRRFLSPAAEAKRQQQLRTQMTSPSRPVQRGSAAVPPLRIPTRLTQLPVHRRGPQRPVQVVSPIPMHFAQAASIHGNSPPMDRSEPYYPTGPSRRPADPVDDILNMYHQHSPTFDISEPFNPGFRQANTTANPNPNRTPGRHVGLGIHVPSSSQQSSGLRRYSSGPQPPSENVLNKHKAKQTKIPSPTRSPRRGVASDTDRLTRSKSTKASSSTWKSGDSGATAPPGTFRRDRKYHATGPRPAPVPQGPNPTLANLEVKTVDRQRRPSERSTSALSAVRDVLSRLTSRSKSRNQLTPSPLARAANLAHRASGTFNTLVGHQSPSPQWACFDAREIERQARTSQQPGKKSSSSRR
ncbi:hypothetical protein QBC40DRAFT_227522 [Triangularia verruculosa]|uniref:Uncharacterized protein n=1 Tax=Triangularia verruculosa TaxID=2587418 RepID=A0AAN6XFC3_9PEZI|nr:hypothetical protein QBC40DRAFT_227522 [Triangularia verruculosa]